MKYSSDASGFVSLGEAVPDALLEIRYYSTFNFIGDRIEGYEAPVALMTREGAAALKKVSDAAIARGYRLKIYDAYRPQPAVDHFVRWAADPDDTRMKAFFYPDLEKDRLFPEGYIAAHSGHSRGSTVDLTLFDTRAQREADMGGYFDYLGALSHFDYPGPAPQSHDGGGFPPPGGGMVAFHSGSGALSGYLLYLSRPIPADRGNPHLKG